MSDTVTRTQAGDMEWRALRKGNDDAIERCVRLLVTVYKDYDLAVAMTRTMAEGERAKRLTAELKHLCELK